MGLGSMIRKEPIPDPGSRIQDTGVKKAPNPGSGSATLAPTACHYARAFSIYQNLVYENGKNDIRSLRY